MSKQYTTTIERFIELAISSQIIDQESIDAELAQFNEQPNRDKTPQGFADWLVEHESLTAWQCKHLLNGKWKGFFVHQFRLIDHHSCDEYCSRYVAEDTEIDRKVIVAVLPISVAKRVDGLPGPVFIVEEFRE